MVVNGTFQSGLDGAPPGAQCFSGAVRRAQKMDGADCFNAFLKLFVVFQGLSRPVLGAECFSAALSGAAGVAGALLRSECLLELYVTLQRLLVNAFLKLQMVLRGLQEFFLALDGFLELPCRVS
ncbi:hypothetical protein NDU88_005358 [Pleurodeles waltl]|uniref:Uncharacterized protein n=1 Tax=Pleurodeles waltl TaxID=8319 RepID=A0AAV7L488_PLEWA|nr:hypothetical protein NDU88_005358 [Pleurodeles waltl]